MHRLVIIAALALPAVALAQSPPRLPTVVSAKIATLDRVCIAAGGRPGKNSYVFAQDFTGDGRLDYLVSEGDYACSGRPQVFRRNGQAAVEIYVTDPRGGAVQAWRQTLLAYRILDQRPRVVQIAHAGAACGAGAAASVQCGATLRWNPTGQRFDSEPIGGRAAPDSSTQAPAPPPATAAPREDKAAFAARCRRETIQRYPGGARWADTACQEKWARVTAAGPLADAILALAPERPGQPPTLAETRARLGAVRWQPRPAARTLATGALGKLTVTVTGAAAVDEVAFGWSEVGAEIPFEAIEALKVRGVPVSPIGCLAFGAGESTEVVRVSPPGRAPFALTVHSRAAPTANAWSQYAVSLDPSGKLPTLAGLRARDRETGWLATCPS